MHAFRLDIDRIDFNPLLEAVNALKTAMELLRHWEYSDDYVCALLTTRRNNALESLRSRISCVGLSFDWDDDFDPFHEWKSSLDLRFEAAFCIREIDCRFDLGIAVLERHLAVASHLIREALSADGTPPANPSKANQLGRTPRNAPLVEYFLMHEREYDAERSSLGKYRRALNDYRKVDPEHAIFNLPLEKQEGALRTAVFRRKKADQNVVT